MWSMNWEQQRVLSYCIFVESLTLLVGLIAYLVHTVLVQYFYRCKKSPNFDKVWRPPLFTPRRICHIGVLAYIAVQINFLVWLSIYIGELDTGRIENQDLVFSYYEYSNLFDISVYLLLFILVLAALKIQLNGMDETNDSKLMHIFDIVWTITVAILILNIMTHISSMVYFSVMPPSLKSNMTESFSFIYTFTTNTFAFTQLCLLLFCLALTLVFMKKVFNTLTNKQAREIKIRSLVCGWLLFTINTVRMFFCLENIVYYSIAHFNEENTDSGFYLKFTDVLFILFLKFLPCFLIIGMMNKPTLGC
ncbi:hypothetical protein EIN_505190 [Entamoeba invadens IP1]|uniref:Uncharacterized protein n=1 Tax=Entamoeba invadens IP1 TaxID=370355 RepID=A0A0A1UDC5_ENTIV|nr:hypothetical protein EIN_505190 [Entamoeba invadens IP1]ELP90313.1 hypothetical protein EIN_505190 [Entamoeba invadens IP1]|eukprot:XP_004257084.1 hypothetical protein EIN_505190 [Entamoeba invadens IP1]